MEVVPNSIIAERSSYLLHKKIFPGDIQRWINISSLREIAETLMGDYFGHINVLTREIGGSVFRRFLEDSFPVFYALRRAAK